MLLLSVLSAAADGGQPAKTKGPLKGGVRTDEEMAGISGLHREDITNPSADPFSGDDDEPDEIKERVPVP